MDPSTSVVKLRKVVQDIAAASRGTLSGIVAPPLRGRTGLAVALSAGRNSTESDALYRDPMHKAAEPVIIVDRFVPSGAVVPHGEITSPPPHTALKLGLFAMLVEKGEDGNGLLVREAFDVRRKYRVHKQSPTPTEWMFDHNRMACILGRCFGTVSYTHLTLPTKA